jgi:hypothetical protein
MTPNAMIAPATSIEARSSFDDEFAIEAEIAAEPNLPLDEDQAFVRACSECERVCFETVDHCITLGGSLADVRDIQLLRNCARVCRNGAASWKVGSRLYSQVLHAAARLCAECATTCERVTGDRQLKICADMCRACAASCERMAERPRTAVAPLTQPA